MKLSLKPVCRQDYKFLYDLLQQRDPKANISHRKMPTYEEHCKFNDNTPYREDYIIFDGDKPIGRFYISQLDELGVHLIKGCQGKVEKDILKQNWDRIKFVNVAPSNKRLQRLLKRLGFKLIQYTYADIR